MKLLKRTALITNSSCLLGIIILFLPLSLLGQENTKDDSLKILLRKEADFIIDQIENKYPYGRRGMDSLEWKHRTEMFYKKVEEVTNVYERLYALRYAGLLINDAHFKFPDIGVYRRYSIFKMTDEIFPIWVKTWQDGTVYCVKDYTATIPKNSQIISVNGHSAKDIALLNRKLMPSEELNAMATMNADIESDPRSWCNFSNFLFTEGIKPPYTVKYINSVSGKIDSSYIQSLTRGDIFNVFKKSGDKRKVADSSESGFFRTPIKYSSVDDKIGVMSLNSFWGRNLVEILLFKRDWTYPRVLKRTMRKIDRSNIETLIIDISKNEGGMTENIYKTLNYFTRDSIDINEEYYITDSNRKTIQTVIKNTPHKDLGLTKQQHKTLVSFIDSVKSDTYFCTDTLFNLQYRPKNGKRYFNGKVYLLSSNMSYSAAQLFSQYFKRNNIGLTAGQPCGGYSNISGGNSEMVKLPHENWWIPFSVPFSRPKYDYTKFDYDAVDIEIERPFEEWLKDEDHTLERLISIIKSDSTQNRIMQAVK